ncbi:MAG: TlyA family RNA methyltransferase [Acidimicrobiia bacterium]|nr:TlyA family RNA methyltransferase [Acidimicrobiia bacterium]
MSRNRLDAELVRRRLASTRSAARHLINEGRVRVAGVVSPKPATMVAAGASIDIIGDGARFVSRGGEKLAHALDEFQIDVGGKRAVDLGASTGGFTDCLLQQGATEVTAVDVGYNQLDYRLRTDSRVVVRERTNVRTADPASLGGPFPVIVADLSFISLELVMPAIAALAADDADIVMLVKPQFEVGKGQVSRGGIVTDPALWEQAVHRIVDAAASHGLGACGLRASPLRGASAGNVEFLLWVRRGPADMPETALEQVLADLPEGNAP